MASESHPHDASLVPDVASHMPESVANGNLFEQPWPISSPATATSTAAPAAAIDATSRDFQLQLPPLLPARHVPPPATPRDPGAPFLFATLSVELRDNIFAFVDLTSLGRCLYVCRQWREEVIAHTRHRLMQMVFPPPSGLPIEIGEDDSDAQLNYMIYLEEWSGSESSWHLNNAFFNREAN